MAGVATAYSTDALTSSGGADNEKWEFAVPLNNDVGSPLAKIAARGELKSGGNDEE